MPSKKPASIKNRTTIFTVIGTGIAILAFTISLFIWNRNEEIACKAEILAALEDTNSMLHQSIASIPKSLERHSKKL